MSDLEKYFRRNNDRLINKWIHYFDVYERHFSRFRDKEIVILEIGVYHGGSLQMWRDYFGHKAKIYAIDVDPRCKDLGGENIKIFIGSQSDRKFLREIKAQIPPIDILIDDGGHTMTQQVVTFEELYDHIKDNGIYLCEDTHTSYWLNYGGGHERKGTFIEYSKNFIDSLNAWHSEQKSLVVNDFTRSANSIHYYDSVVIIEKKKRNKPFSEMTGNPSFQDVLSENNTSSLNKLITRRRYKMIIRINKILRYFKFPSYKLDFIQRYVCSK